MDRITRAGSGIAARLSVLLAVVLLLAACSDNPDSVFSAPVSEPQAVSSVGTTVPWDYRIDEGTVGDLIGSDMTILPDNSLMANDNNYATGDKVWILQYMSAMMKENEQGKASVQLSAWRAIKTYRDRSEADEDLDRLKVELKTKADLIGVYKTKLGGKTRQFAVIELPSGQQVKQPIDEDRYAMFKDAKQADIYMEEVHDYEQFDSVYSKFRGWVSS